MTSNHTRLRTKYATSTVNRCPALHRHIVIVVTKRRSFGPTNSHAVVKKRNDDEMPFSQLVDLFRRSPMGYFHKGTVMQGFDVSVIVS